MTFLLWKQGKEAKIYNTEQNPGKQNHTRNETKNVLNFKFNHVKFHMFRLNTQKNILNMLVGNSSGL